MGHYEIFAQDEECEQKSMQLKEKPYWWHKKESKSFCFDTEKSLAWIVNFVQKTCDVDLSAKTKDGDDAYTVYCDDGVFYGDMLANLQPDPPKDDYVTVIYTNRSDKAPYTLSELEQKALEEKEWKRDMNYDWCTRYTKKFPDSGSALLEFKSLIKRDYCERFYDYCETCSYGKVHSMKMEEIEDGCICGETRINLF